MKLNKRQIVMVILVILMCLSLAAPVATEFVYPRIEEPKKDAGKKLKSLMHEAAPWSKLAFRLCVIVLAAMLVAPASKKRSHYAEILDDLSDTSLYN